MSKIAVIGSGFSSLASACYLAQAGYDVEVFEKNEQIGGRARRLEVDGFTFDMGPSWYWMPDVFERFFSDFDRKPSDYYELQKLSPAYRVYFDDGTSIEIPDNLEQIYEVFEREEPGSSKGLKVFMQDAADNYKVSIGDLVYKPGLSPLELVSTKTISKLHQFFSSIRFSVNRTVKSPKLRKILEFPVLFLGAKPQNTPSFYNFMNHADFALGTWYPQGGMKEVVYAMHSLAVELGVRFRTNAGVKKIWVDNGELAGLTINDAHFAFDAVVSGADYEHTEKLLDAKYRSYSDTYWSRRVFAPSALLYYLGFDKKFMDLEHHMLFFDAEFDIHAKDIYDKPNWPKSPLFYASIPSISDKSVAPAGQDCMTLLIPLAPGLEDTDELREKYLELLLDRLEERTGQNFRDHVVYKSSYCVSDFEKDYNAYKGNAYGLANTLTQTAFMRPGLKSKKVKNLFFTGQLTVPGPGVPPALISGKLSAELVMKDVPIKTENYEELV